MIRYDHDGYLAACRLAEQHIIHGRDSTEFQSWLRVVLREYDLAQVIVALCAIACCLPDRSVPMMSELARDAETVWYSRFESGEFDE